MIVQLAQISPWIIGPVAFGILTIFGRKGKKDENEEDEKQAKPVKQDKATAVQKPETPTAKPSAPTTITQRPNSPSATDLNLTEPTTTPEETSLNKLLQSLLQDVPFTPSADNESSSMSNTSTPDWVPPRATPPSRPMIITPGDKGERVPGPTEPEPPTKAPRPPEPESRPTQEIAKPTTPPPPLAPAKPAEDDSKKIPKPEKPERLETKPPSAPQIAPKTPQGFDHIFDLTQGALKAPGLVIINGPSGSGKTTISSNLAGSILKTGNPCIMLTYDQPAASLRDLAKQTGWDATQFESQFRLLIIDGYSTQTDSFTMETYYVEKPFDMDSLTDTLLRNSQIFIGSNIQVIWDSLTNLASKIPSKDFLNKFRDLANQMKSSGSTTIVTVDETKLSKDLVGSLEDLANCVIDLQRDTKGNGQLKVRKLNGSASKSQPEAFEIEPGKGLLFA